MTNASSKRGFTLTELLVVIGVIAILAALTVLAFRGIADGARMSSAKNAVIASLDNARALAMQNNNHTLVVFRPRLEGREEVVVEAMVMEWTGESFLNGTSTIIDRFVPADDIATRRLPEGIKVAAPFYGVGADFDWVTQTHLPAIDPNSPDGGTSEIAGQLISVMYNPAGEVVTRNSLSDSNRTWADFDNEDDDFPMFRRQGVDYDPSDGVVNLGAFQQWFEDDETNVNAAPFIIVFDDRDARERRLTDWTSAGDYANELTGPNGYITTYADRIHFNRYTGAALK